MQKKKIRIVVSADVAEVLSRQKNKSAYVEQAVRWYARYGEDCLKKLDRIIEMLAAGSFVSGKATVVERQGEIEDAFASFEV